MQSSAVSESSPLSKCVDCEEPMSLAEKGEYGGLCFACYLSAHHPEGSLSVDLPRPPPTGAVRPKESPRSVLKTMTVTVVDPSGALHPLEAFAFSSASDWHRIRAALIRSLKKRNVGITPVTVARLDEATFQMPNNDVIQSSKQLKVACQRGPTTLRVSLPEAAIWVPPEPGVDAAAFSPTRTKASWSWRCHYCAERNDVADLESYQDFLKATTAGSTLALLEVRPYVVCAHCHQDRRWECGHVGCGAASPAVLCKPGGRIVPWMSCLCCSRFRMEYWRCPSCTFSNTPGPSGETSEICRMCSTSGGLYALYTWLAPEAVDPLGLQLVDRRGDGDGRVAYRTEPPAVAVTHTVPGRETNPSPAVSSTAGPPYKSVTPVPLYKAVTPVPPRTDVTPVPPPVVTAAVVRPPSGPPPFDTTRAVPEPVKSNVSDANVTDAEQKEDPPAVVVANVVPPQPSSDPAPPSPPSPRPPPNLSAVSTLEALIDEHRFNPEIRRKVQQLRVLYNAWRSVRGDGNCYYRSVASSMLTHCIVSRTPSVLQRLADRFLPVSAKVTSAQRVVMTLQSLVSRIELLDSEADVAALDTEVTQWFIDDDVFDKTMVQLMRHLTASYVSEHQDTVVNGIDYATISLAQDRSIEAYCNEVVLEMGEDARDIVLHALPLALGIKVRCVYLDRRQGVDLMHVDYPSSASPIDEIHAHILLKPGHFDILYPKPLSALPTPAITAMPGYMAPRSVGSPVVEDIVHAAASQALSSPSPRAEHTIAIRPSPGLLPGSPPTVSPVPLAVQHSEGETKADAPTSDSGTGGDVSAMTDGMGGLVGSIHRTDRGSHLVPMGAPSPTRTLANIDAVLASSTRAGTAVVPQPSDEADAARVDGLCGQRLFLSNSGVDMRLTRDSSGGSLYFSDDYNVPFDLWTVQRRTPGQPELLLVHTQSETTLMYASHLLRAYMPVAASAAPSHWLLKFVAGSTEEFHLEHRQSGMYLAASEAGAPCLLSGVEVEDGGRRAVWSLMNAD